MSTAFAVWITGLPASGKSTLAAALRTELEVRGIPVAVLESDELRKVFTPRPRYDEEERDAFYASLAYVGRLLVSHGISVIFDATANRRRYRERARREIDRFLEVHVRCPVAVCLSRDPKGIYREGRGRLEGSVPGLHAEYEPPRTPDVVVEGDREAAENAARRIIFRLQEKRFLAVP